MKGTLLFIVALLLLTPQATGAQSRRKAPRPSARKTVNVPPPAEEDEEVEEARAVVSQSVPEGFMERELMDLQQRPFRLSNFKDKIIVLNLWATWCGPCRVEIPELETLSREFAGRVRVVGLTVESPDEAQSVQQFVRSTKLSYKVGFIEREDAIALMTTAPIIPQTFIIDGKGRILSHLKGYRPKVNLTKLREAVRQALASAGSGR